MENPPQFWNNFDGGVMKNRYKEETYELPLVGAGKLGVIYSVGHERGEKEAARTKANAYISPLIMEHIPRSRRGTHTPQPPRLKLPVKGSGG